MPLVAVVAGAAEDVAVAASQGHAERAQEAVVVVVAVEVVVVVAAVTVAALE